MLRQIGLYTLLISMAAAADADLARRRRDADTRWASFENPTAAKGQAAKDNRGAKGHAFESLKPGETKALLDVTGSGSVRRIWITVRDRSPRMLRSMRLEMFWDGAAEPAVSVPFGDFFGAILGRTAAFENELFSNPEGRSFNCYIPMPFRKGARITLTNESKDLIPYVFYKVDYLQTAKPDPDLLYFHAFWNRVPATALGEDYVFLPQVKGEGRFLGVHFGVIANPKITGWWGEGEVKMHIDGDTQFPTLSGTGAEDYIGTGWGQGTFANRYQGCLVSDKEHGRFGSYRYHVPDPVYFHKEIRVTIHAMGGDEKKNVIVMLDKGAPIRPVTLDANGDLKRLLEMSPVPDIRTVPGADDAWVNVYRQDDWSSVALFYLDAPMSGLARMGAVETRTAGLE